LFESVRIKCPFCLQSQELEVDPGGGENQSVIVDCEICCHPMDIQIVWSEEKQRYRARVEKSSGF
jgi:hypothetical protein